ncbi:unnamed protein product, partial [Urochloa humidicola]
MGGADASDAPSLHTSGVLTELNAHMKSRNHEAAALMSHPRHMVGQRR